MSKAKNVPIDIYKEPECQRVKGRGFKNNDVNRGYMSEDMYEYPNERHSVRDKRWREESEEMYGEN